MYGLSNFDIEIIKKVLAEFPSVESAWIYGSRAMGNQKQGSDVDIALKGENIDYNTIIKVSTELNEETPLPYRFDIICYHHIKKKQLKDHIDRVEQMIYKREE